MRFLFAFLFFVSLLVFSVFVQSYSLVTLGDVSSGKNFVVFNNSFFVKDFVKYNPSVESVTYYNSDNSSVGFVNVFGGVGDNFLIVSNKSYEVFSSSNSTLIIPK